MNKIDSSYKKEYMLSENDIHISYLHPYPVTLATTIIESKNQLAKSIFDLPISEYKQLLFSAKKVANLLCQNLPVSRCALITQPVKYGTPQIKLVPLHGIDSSEWKEILHTETEFNEEYPGYCNSKNGPLLSDEQLKEIQDRIRSKLEKTTSISYEFLGDSTDANLFAKLVRGEIKQWRVWEDTDHVAFLTPFPNTPGFTVVVPRRHLSSDIFSLKDCDFEKIIEAGYKVSSQIKDTLSVKYNSMIFEGYEIDYAHIKLIPVHAKNEDKIENKNLSTEFHSKYVGYVTSLDGPLFPREEMQNILQRIKKYVSN